MHWYPVKKRKRIWLSGAIVAILFTVAVFHGKAYAKKAHYLTIARCKGCHKKWYKSWRTNSSMSFQSYKALFPNISVDNKTEAGLDPQKDYTKVSLCLKCHVTGYGVPGGYVDNDTTPEMGGVTCEACHGPGSKYFQSMSKKRRTFTITEIFSKEYVRPTQATCNRCHHGGDERCPTVDDDYSMDFDKSAAHENFSLRYEH
ncbi:MAG: multiheme c-type cytochrome [bacterium]